MTESFTQRYFWAGHSNPASVWTAIASFPLVVLALYRRDLRLLAVAASLTGITALAFSEPADDSAWATQVVRGEQVWLDRGLASSPLDLLVIVAGAPVILGTFRAALRQRPLQTAIGTVLSILVMFVFFERMHRLYEQSTESQTGEQVVSTT